jgi:aspartyl-tRNA synthetase
MLIGAGFERVFEIAPAFRAEPSDTVAHVTEFSSLDAEVGFIDSVEDVRAVLEGVVADAFRSTRKELLERGNPLAEKVPEPTVPFPRVTFAQCMEWLGRPGSEEDLGREAEKAIGELVEKKFGAPLYFITDFPTAIKVGTFYAQRQDANPRLTYYFDLDFKGLEIASGGAREHRVDRLRANIETAGLDPEKFAGYLEAFRFGMPPHGGWGLGVDRIVQVLAGLSNIREAILFPRDRYRLDP